MDEVDEVYDARWPFALVVVLALMGAVLVAAMLMAERSSGESGSAADQRSGATAEPSPAAVEAPDRAVTMLRAWDRARSRAWASGDVASLRKLYVADSSAGARDAAMLRTWTSRGLHVEDLGVQLLAVREVRRTTSRLVLRVTDRMVGGVAVGPEVRLPLPNDAASTRRIHLQRIGGVWRVAAVARAG